MMPEKWIGYQTPPGAAMYRNKRATILANT
jgi:hypothetical protein